MAQRPCDKGQWPGLAFEGVTEHQGPEEGLVKRAQAESASAGEAFLLSCEEGVSADAVPLIVHSRGPGAGGGGGGGGAWL